MEVKRILGVLALLFISIVTYAQSFKYFVAFKDRDNSPFSIAQPLDFLSQKSIDRRAAHGISIQQNDLPPNPSYVDSIAAYGVTVFGRSKWFNGIIISTGDTSVMAAIRNVSFVKGSKIVQRHSQRSVSDKFSFLENNQAVKSSTVVSTASLDYGASFNQVNQIGCDCLHDLGYQGQNMTIAVLDAGFPQADVLSAFDTLWTNSQIKGGWDFVDNDNSIFGDNQHGSMVLSCMGGNVPGQLIGTAPKANYYLLHTEDAPIENIVEEYYWLLGAEYADSVGADIIHSSLGYTEFDNASQNHTYADMDGDHTPAAIAADIAASKGLIVNASAGNSGYDPWYYISTPADGDSVIAVGAVDEFGAVAGFSSRGPAPDGRIKPNVMAKGVDAIVAQQDGSYSGANGTSFAGPIMAGAIACLWQMYPQMSNMQIKDALEQSASMFSTPDADYGYGIPNVCVANLILSGAKKDDIVKAAPKVFPNPTLNDLKITFYSRDTQTTKLEVYDITGKLILTDEQFVAANSYNTITIDKFNSLQNGIYVVKFRTREKEYISQIVRE